MDQQLSISVIIPSHNPRLDYLKIALVALKAQTLPSDQWELIVVDNASKQPLVADSGCRMPDSGVLSAATCSEFPKRRESYDGECVGIDLSWHPMGRVVREEKLGLTHARLRGFAEAKAPLIVFVDDDNVLEKNYLEVALALAHEHLNLGVWSGQVFPEFESSPCKEIQPFLHVLCLRELEADIWGNHRNTGLLPFGAGMCVRKNVAARYVEQVKKCSQRLELGRKGDLLTSSEDLDLALTCIDLGMGTGLFRRLRLTHLIPARRLQKEYILKLFQDSAMGHAIFEKARGIPHPPEPRGIDKLVATYKLWRATPMQKAVHAARLKGYQNAQKPLSGNPTSK